MGMVNIPTMVAGDGLWHRFYPHYLFLKVFPNKSFGSDGSSHFRASKVQGTYLHPLLDLLIRDLGPDLL